MAESKYLYVHDWRQHQSYRADRGIPPWIKLQRSMLRNRKWLSLSEIERCHLISIWIYAADNDGRVPNDAAIIRRACGLDTDPDLKLFISLNLLDAKPTTKRRQPDAKETPERRHDDAPEAEVEAEEEVEIGRLDNSSSSARARDPTADRPTDAKPNGADPPDAVTECARRIAEMIEREWGQIVPTLNLASEIRNWEIEGLTLARLEAVCAEQFPKLAAKGLGVRGGLKILAPDFRAAIAKAKANGDESYAAKRKAMKKRMADSEVDAAETRWMLLTPPQRDPRTWTDEERATVEALEARYGFRRQRQEIENG